MFPFVVQLSSALTFELGIVMLVLSMLIFLVLVVIFAFDIAGAYTWKIFLSCLLLDLNQPARRNMTAQLQKRCSESTNIGCLFIRFVFAHVEMQKYTSRFKTSTG